MKSKHIAYQELNLSVNSPYLELNSSALSLRFKQLWNWLVNVCLERDEPRVWQTKDRTGEIWWHVYDSTTGQSACFSSETAIRVWLEQRC